MTNIDYTNFPRAGIIRRLASWLYDTLVAIAVYMVAGAISFLVFGFLFDHGIIANKGFEHAFDLKSSSYIYSLLVDGFAWFWVGYFFIFFWVKSGQTIGMKAWRLRVQNQDGSLMDKSTALKRLLPTLLGLGNLWLLVNRQQKLSLQDKFTNTEVVVLSNTANRGR
ncbi:RDD family protein [Thalassotalea insulae]|nr:RDD family protein [Thalassotalea insulae]